MEGLLLSGEKLGQGDRNLLLRDAALLLSEKVPDSEIPSLLEDLLATLELRDRLEVPLAQGERALLAGLLRHGRKNESPVPLPELRDRIFLGRYAGASDDRNLVGNLPEEREYRDVIFGYVLVPGTSRSDLFVLRAGLSIRKEPLLPSEILAMKKMLLPCQGREGGFGPVGGAIPTLEATWTALDLLRLLLPGAAEGEPVLILPGKESGGYARLDIGGSIRVRGSGAQEPAGKPQAECHLRRHDGVGKSYSPLFSFEIPPEIPPLCRIASPHAFL
jgi:hypothetical protein